MISDFMSNQNKTDKLKRKKIIEVYYLMNKINYNVNTCIPQLLFFMWN